MQTYAGRCLEMSRYIDLDLYHKVEKTHPFYIEMVDEICTQIRNFCRKDKKYRILEIGAGTGLLTQELLKFPFLEVHAVEIDEACCRVLREHIKSENCKIVQGDAATFCQRNYFDMVVSCFAHDHIHYGRASAFVKNIKENLCQDGVYIMGGEILPYYSDMGERREALYKYHCYIINKALLDGNFEVGQIEIQALKSGLEMKGDFKRHESMFEEEMASADMKLITKNKIGPKDINNVGGVFVYVYGR